MKTKLGIACAAAVIGLSFPALSQNQNGLVNVLVGDNTVQVPIGIAAQVCGTDANIIAQQFKGTDETVCEIDQETAAQHNIRGQHGGNAGGGGQTDQDGLVNVAVEGNTVQVPVSVAAQVCDLNANVLSRQYVGSNETACEIDQETAAEHGISG